MSDVPAPQDEHETMRESLPAAALDALSDAEMHHVLAHVGACESCRAELATLRLVASQLTYATPLEPVDGMRRDDLRARLHARALVEGRAAGGSSVDPAKRTQPRLTPTHFSRRVVPWLALAALAASIIAMIGLVRDRRDLSLRVERERSQWSAEVASLRGELSARDTLLSALIGPSVRVIPLSAPAPRAAGALMFWNRATDRWTLVAHDLPPLPAGRTYQLWLVLASGPRSVAVFTPDEHGNARVSARLPLDLNARPQIAITSEPAGGSSRPTTNPLAASAPSE